MAKKESNHQGDVYVKSVKKIPDGLTEIAKKNGKTILALGEATGHHHRFEEDHVRMYVANDNRRFLVVEGKPATLLHEEHSPIEFAPGEYEIFIAREWSDDNEPVPVID